MSRNVSSTLKQAVFAQQTDQVFLVLLALTHSSFPNPIRVVHNTVNITSNGDVYTAVAFGVSMPDEEESYLSGTTLVIDNTDRSIVEQVRSVSSPLDVEMKIIRAADPDVVEVGPYNFTLRDVQWNSESVSGKLRFAEYLEDAWPYYQFEPDSFPGLF